MTIDIEQEGKLWVATSPDVRGLLVAGHSRDECLNGIAQALNALEEAAREPRSQ